MRLSNRLKAVASMVTLGNVVADIGTDHGYVPIYLIKEGLIKHALAMDINEAPLQSAKENIATYDCEQAIKTRLSNGVEALKANEADTVIIAGMGGNLIMKILSAGREVLVTAKELILQPQSEIAQVRCFLQANGYCIIAEDMVYEDGKYYPMMKIVHGVMNLTRDIDFIYGPYLLGNKSQVLKQFLDKEDDTLQKIAKQISEAGSDLSASRQDKIKQEMCFNKLARKEYEE